jgi:hypothetical protein
MFLDLKLTDKQKIILVARIAIISFLVMMLYAPKLWLTEKAFPVIPLFDFIPIPKYPFDIIFALLLAGLMILFFIKPKKTTGIAIVLLYFYLALVDQNRLQPYFYQSVLIILCASYLRKSRKNTTIVLHCLMLIFIATYFFSGIHKINANFNTVWMHAFSKHFGFLPKPFIVTFTRSVPYIEAIIGLMLFFNKTRRLAVLAIITMHLGIVTLLITFGYGFNVIPWNLQNILSVFILFWNYKSKYPFDIVTQYFNYKKAVILFLTFVLPTTNLFGFWDHLLSFSFFSAKLNYYYIELNDADLINKLPNEIKTYIFDYNGKKIINLNDWAGSVNGVLFYPEDRVAKKTQRYLESFSIKKNTTKLVEYHHRKSD